MTDAMKPTAPVTQAPAAAKPASATTIKLDGKEIELHGITTEQGQKIYDVLPAEYKQRADSYAAIAKNVERVLKIDRPDGMSVGQAWKNYSDAIKSGTNFGHDNVAPYLKQFDAAVKGTPLESIRRGDKVADTLGHVVDGVNAGVSDVANALDNAAKFFGVVGNEAKGSVRSALGLGISDAQAKAFGAVFAAAAYHESAVRQGLPVVSFTSFDSLVAKYPGAALGAAAEHATSSVPIASDAWTLIVAAAKFVKTFVSSLFGENKDKDLPWGERLSKTWEASLAEARAEHAAKNPSLTYEERLTARVQAGETERAADKVKKAELVAEIKTQEMVPAVTGNAPYVGKDGTTRLVTIEGGKMVDEPLVDKDGKSVGRGDRVKDAAGGLFPATGAALKEGDKGTLVGVIGGGAAAVVVAKPVVVGAVEGTVRGVMNRPDRLASAAEKKMWELEDKSAKATNPKKIAAFEAAADKAEAKMHHYDKVAKHVEGKVGAIATSESKMVAKVGQTLEKILDTPAEGQSFLRRWSRTAAEKVAGAATWAAEKTVGGADKALALGGKVVEKAGHMAGSTSKLLPLAKGAGVAGMVVTPLVASGEIVQGIVKGDKAEVAEGSAKLVTMGTIAATGMAGAAIVAGVISAPVTVPVLATGAVVAGIAYGAVDLTKAAYEWMKGDAEVKTSTAVQPKPAGALGAPDKGLEVAAVAATQKAEQARIAQVVADAATDVERARMAANRTPFARVASTNIGTSDLGTFKLDGVPPASQAVAQLSVTPMA